ncbi:MAG: hypothetical protein ABII88_09935 [Candidatus Omnitrophota bacterium]
MMKRNIKVCILLLTVLLLSSKAYAEIEAEEFGIDDDSMVQSFVYTIKNERDPFIPLLDVQGTKPKLEPVLREEEFRKLLANITINGILWDEQMPLVMINNKIRKKGDNINGLFVMDIKEDSVVVGYQDLTQVISLVKKENEIVKED